jgi:hypothetical protein
MTSTNFAGSWDHVGDPFASTTNRSTCCLWRDDRNANATSSRSRTLSNSGSFNNAPNHIEVIVQITFCFAMMFVNMCVVGISTKWMSHRSSSGGNSLSRLQPNSVSSSLCMFKCFCCSQSELRRKFPARIILTLPLIVLMWFVVDKPPPCLYDLRILESVEGRALVCDGKQTSKSSLFNVSNDVDIGETADSICYDKQARAKNDFSPRGMKQNVLSTSICTQVKINPSLAILRGGAGENTAPNEFTFFSSPGRNSMNMTAQDLSVVLDQIPSIVLTCLNFADNALFGPGKPLHECFQALLMVFSDAVALPCTKVEGVTECVPFGKPCQAACNNVIAVCFTSKNIPYLEKILSTQGYSNALSNIIQELETGNGETGQAAVILTALIKDDTGAFQRGGRQMLIDFLVMMWKTLLANLPLVDTSLNASLAKLLANSDLRECFNYLDKNGDKTPSVLDCSGEDSEDGLRTILVKAGTYTEKSFEFCNVDSVTGNQSSSKLEEIRCERVCGPGADWMSRFLGVGISTFVVGLFVWCVQIMDTTIFCANYTGMRQKQARVIELHNLKWDPNPLVDAEIGRVATPSAVHVVRRKQMPIHVHDVKQNQCSGTCNNSQMNPIRVRMIFSLLITCGCSVLLLLKVHLLLGMYFEGSHLYLVACLLVIWFGGLIICDSSAIVLQSGAAEVQKAMRLTKIRRRSRTSLTFTSGKMSALDVLKDKDECRCHGGPKSWYDRNFSYRGGTFFFYKVFVGEMFEWVVQIATMQSLVHLQDINYSIAALLLLVINVALCPWMFLFRNWNESFMREFCFLADTLLDGMFFYLTFLYTSTEDDLTSPVFILGFIGPFPAILAGICYPAFRLLVRSRAIARALMVNLVESSLAKKKPRYSFSSGSFPRGGGSGSKRLENDFTVTGCKDRFWVAADKQRRYIAETLLAMAVFASLIGVLIHALVIILEADDKCREQIKPYDALWKNAYPRIVSRKVINSTFQTSAFKSETIPLSLGTTDCRFDLVKTTFALEGEIGVDHNVLPSSLSSWTQLEKMDVRWNNITHIPVEMLEMRTLKRVLFAGNPVHSFLNLSGNNGSGSLPYRLCHLSEGWDLSLVGLDLTNNGLSSLPVDLQTCLPCLREVWVGNKEPLLRPIRMPLFQAWESYNSSDSCQTQTFDQQFRIRSGDAVMKTLTPEVDWSRDATIISSKNEAQVWTFLSSDEFQILSLNLRCSGMRLLNFDWLESQPRSSQLHSIDLSDNTWIIEKEDEGSVDKISRIWILVEKLRREGNLKSFKMENSNLGNKHFMPLSAIFIDQVINANGFEDFSVRNNPVLELNWERTNFNSSGPPLWLATQLAPTLETFVLKDQRYNQSGAELFEALSQSRHLKDFTCHNCFRRDTVIPSRLWTLENFLRIELRCSYDEMNFDYDEMIFEGVMPTSLTHMKSLHTFIIRATYNIESRKHQLLGQLPLFAANIAVVVINSVNLHGPIPDKWEELKSLRYISLVNMNISGPVKGLIFREMSKLTLLKLQSLDISGSYPWDDGFVHLFSSEKSCEELYLQDNVKMTGSLLPSEFPHRCVLARLIISNHPGLSGSIPPSINRCTLMNQLLISNVGELQGEIPWEVCSMCNLTSLKLPSTNASRTFLKSCKKNRSSFCGDTLPLSWILQVV